VMGLDEIEAEEELAKIDDEIIDAYAMDGWDRRRKENADEDWEEE
jgi:hypothetical protein